MDVHEMSAARVLNAMNENIGSLGEVDFLAYGVARPSTLVSLSLHSNRLSSLEGFASMTVSTYDLLLYFGLLLSGALFSRMQQSGSGNLVLSAGASTSRGGLLRAIPNSSRKWPSRIHCGQL